MVIREILDGYDRAIAAARNQQKMLEEMKARVLACCRADAPPAVAGSIGCEEGPKKKRTPRAA